MLTRRVATCSSYLLTRDSIWGTFFSSCGPIMVASRATVLGNTVCHLRSAIRTLCYCCISFVAQHPGVFHNHIGYSGAEGNPALIGHTSYASRPHSGVPHSGNLRSATLNISMAASNEAAQCVGSECG